MSEPSEMQRIIVGNQIAIMRALATSNAIPASHTEALKRRVADVKGYWRSEFGQEVGFDASLGDRHE